MSFPISFRVLPILTALALLPVPERAAPAVAECPGPLEDGYLDCVRDVLRDEEVKMDIALTRAQDMARELDLYLVDGQMPAMEVLAIGQEAWLQYRQAGCATESLLVRGLPEESEIYYDCVLRLTRARIEALNEFGSVR